MGSISNSPTGLSYLTQPGGVLSNLPASISQDLATASPQDVVTLSDAALQAQEVDGIFGLDQSTQNTAVSLPILSGSTPDVLPGVAASDLTNATPQQQTAINTQALGLQEVQGLFGGTLAPTSTTNVTG
jgi:hypothetical protein